MHKITFNLIKFFVQNDEAPGLWENAARLEAAGFAGKNYQRIF
jgi:hypothetical protein